MGLKNKVVFSHTHLIFLFSFYTLFWNSAIIRVVENIYPEAKIQRCLTHIHRQTRNYISKNPKTKAGKQLKKLITFKAFNNEKSFIRKYNFWEKKYYDFLNERTVNGSDSRYTHRRSRSAKSHIKNAIPYMFYYLNDKNIKKSNNDLEGLNGILNTQISRHKGLRIDRLISFISLWIYERNLREK